MLSVVFNDISLSEPSEEVGEKPVLREREKVGEEPVLREFEDLI
jgi:hypothetical protein